MTRRVTLYLVLPLPLAVAWAMAAGLLGFWVMDAWWQWILALAGFLLALKAAWEVAKEARGQ